METGGTARAGRLVGRESELAAVEDFLSGGLLPEPRALLLLGEAGIGKTTLIRAAVGAGRSAGLRVFEARPTAGEAQLPYAALGDLLFGVGADSLAMLAGSQVEAIESALGRAEAGASVQELAVQRGLLELLRTEGADGRLLVAVDDLQWLDRPTASALAFALRRVGSLGLRVIAAERTSPGQAPETPLGMQDWVDLRPQTLRAMPATELGVLIRDRLGVQLARPRLKALASACHGNPMFALELARYGAADRSSMGLSSAVGERLRAIDEEALAAVSVASAALNPTTDLLYAAGVTPAQLRAAVRSGVVDLDDDRVGFAHPLLAETAYALLLPDERRNIHARLAPASVDLVEQGQHVSRFAVGRDEYAAGLLDMAAADASRRADHARAAEFWLRAAELSAEPDGDRAAQRAVRAAAELNTAGDVAATVELCRSLVDRLPAGPLRARARWLLSWCREGSGVGYADVLAEYRIALEEAAGDDALTGELHLMITEGLLGICQIDDALAHARLSMAAAERAGATSISIHAQGYVGFAQSMLGLGVTGEARQAMRRWDGTISWQFVSPRTMLACELIPALAFEDAEDLLVKEIEAAQHDGLEVTEVVARAHLAESQVRAGRWAESLASAQTSVEHARQAAVGQIVAGASSALAMTYALLGQHDIARDISSRVLTRAEASDDFWFSIAHRCVLGLVALAELRPQEAIEVLEPAWRLMLERNLGDLSLFPVAPVLGECLVMVGRPDDAAVLCDALADSPVGDQPWSRMILHRTHALVASARGDHAAAVEQVTAAMDTFAQVPEPFEQARTMLIAARVERAARNWGAARARLVDALERFDLLGAARWSDLTAADIARLPGRHPGDKRALTAREREVCALAVDGLTNKEIAARLVVSVGTVEANLSKAYAKLGVRSRTELASRVDRLGEPKQPII